MNLFAIDQIICHLLGDYFFQNQWMAINKRQSKWAALVHGVAYTLPFLLLTQNPIALAAIAVSHSIVDHYSLARYVVWGQNQCSPYRYSFREMNGAGFVKDSQTPSFIQFFVYVMIDNTMHIIGNGFILYFLT